MLEQLYRDLTTFHLFSSNLRVVLNMLQQQAPGDLLLILKDPQSFSEHAGAAVQAPGDLPLVPKQPQSCSKYAAEAVQGPDDLSPCSQATSKLF